MATLTPYAKLSVGTDKDVFGSVPYKGDALTWPLLELFGAQDCPSTGWAVDPTGNYLCQTPVYLPLNADETQWLLSFQASDAASAPNAVYAHGTDEQTGKTFLRQTNGSAGVVFDATFRPAAPHRPDSGFYLRIYRGGAVASTVPGDVAGDGTSNHTLSVEFSEGREPGLPGLRLVAEAGQPLRLEVTQDDGQTYQTVAAADGLGDSETYLSRSGRELLVDVCPQTDAAYYDAPPDQCFADPPPSQVAVTIGHGDAVLVWRAEQATLAEGSVRIHGLGGQWGCRYYKRRYVAQSTLTLREQSRPVPFQSEAVGRVTGYVPFDALGGVVGTVTDTNKATATLTVQPGKDNQDTDGTAFLSAFLTLAHLDFPPLQVPPLVAPPLVEYTPVEWDEEHTFDQTRFYGTKKLIVKFADPDNTLAPGSGVALGVRGAIFERGLRDADTGYDDVQVGVTGLTALDDDGLTWEWGPDGIKYFTCTVTDFIDPDIPCEWMLAMDGQCQYYAARQVGYALGFTDQRMPFPYCERDSACAHYHLPQGTAFDPLLRPKPDMSALDFLLQIRANSGEYDFATGVVQPMYLYEDQDGNLQFYAAPVGLVQTWLNPDLTPESQTIVLEKTYSVVPQFTDDGLPVLNEFIRSGPMGSRASLKNIRTDIVVQGVRPSDGAFLDGYANLPDLVTNPSRGGYIGRRKSFIHTSKLFSSPEAVEIGLQAAAVQMFFPAIGAHFTAHLQAGLFALQAIGIQEPGTMGTAQVVAFYTTHVRHSGAFYARPGGTWARTDVQARLLGQAG